MEKIVTQVHLNAHLTKFSPAGLSWRLMGIDGELELYTLERDVHSEESELPLILGEFTCIHLNTDLEAMRINLTHLIDLSSICPRHNKALRDMPSNVGIFTQSTQTVFVPPLAIWNINTCTVSVSR